MGGGLSRSSLGPAPLEPDEAARLFLDANGFSGNMDEELGPGGFLPGRDSPLHAAAREGNTWMTNYILGRPGCSQGLVTINAKGEIPLQVASARGHLDVCQLLHVAALGASLPSHAPPGSGVDGFGDLAVAVHALAVGGVAARAYVAAAAESLEQRATDAAAAKLREDFKRQRRRDNEAEAAMVAARATACESDQDPDAPAAPAAAGARAPVAGSEGVPNKGPADLAGEPKVESEPAAKKSPDPGGAESPPAANVSLPAAAAPGPETEPPRPEDAPVAATPPDAPEAPAPEATARQASATPVAAPEAAAAPVATPDVPPVKAPEISAPDAAAAKKLEPQATLEGSVPETGQTADLDPAGWAAAESGASIPPTAASIGASSWSKSREAAAAAAAAASSSVNRRSGTMRIVTALSHFEDAQERYAYGGQSSRESRGYRVNF